MPQEVNGFMLFADQERLLSLMDDEQCGKLMRALYAHNAGRDAALDDPLVKMAFWQISESMDRVKAHTEAKRLAGSSGGKQRASREQAESKQRASRTQAESKQNSSRTQAESKQTSSRCQAEATSEYEYESEDIKKTTSSSSPAAAEDAPPIAPCPQSKILELYHNTLPTLPKMKVWQGSARENNLRARWKERWEAGSYRTLQDGIDYWQRLFGYVRQCPFLMGEVEQRGRDSPFVADLAWIVKRENFIKIIEGKYERRTA